MHSPRVFPADDSDSMCKGDMSFDEARRQAQQKRKRGRKKLTESTPAGRFSDLYRLTGEVLGEGACASVQTARNIVSDREVAVKIIDKYPGYPRSRVFKEIDTFHHCKNHTNIIQLIEYVEEEERFYLVFEKVQGGEYRQRGGEACAWSVPFKAHSRGAVCRQLDAGDIYVSYRFSYIYI